MDAYIDHHETQTYGPRFSDNLRRLFAADAPKPVVAILQWCAEQLDAATLAMRAAMAAHRGASSARRAAAEDKLPVVTSARDELRAFGLHLAACKADVHNPWSGDLDLFFPGGRSAIGEGARHLHHATLTARDMLQLDLSVPERAKWLKRLDAQAKALDPLVVRVAEAERSRVAALSEQSAEKRTWLRTYRGAALVLEGLLLLARREGEYTAAVPHLTAPGTRKKGDGAPNVPTGPVVPTPDA